MKISTLQIRNFRGIKEIDLSPLSQLVVLAGQNGSGKSCVLDAIRLLKSVYGGYQPNEYSQWFGEFQINLTNDPAAFSSLFNDPREEMRLAIEIELSQEEKRYLSDEAEQLVRQSVWRTIAPETYGWKNFESAPLASQYRSREAEVNEATTNELQFLRAELTKPTIKGVFALKPHEGPTFEPSKVLEIVFSFYRPEHIGIIDYHGPHRLYAREQVQNININLQAIDEQRRNSILYNSNTKYAQIKSEMAGLYISEALSERAGTITGRSESLTETLQELFAVFFPEKRFLGPQPTAQGTLSFPVLIGERTHDLDELSSGEKEILYGYLRLRSSARKDSVVLLDEPELHLNPRLTKKLPKFYFRYLARPHNNQIWLVTHSDAVLRETVGHSDYSVFHMVPSGVSEANSNQARRVRVNEDLERAIVDLVGDLAAYTPGASLVIFEGQKSEFDLKMVSDLFSDFVVKMNAISGTNKARVRGLHAILSQLEENAKLPIKVFSVTDRDSEPISSRGAREFSWDVYHIENYLLEPRYISTVINEIGGHSEEFTEIDAAEELKLCARETLGQLVQHEIASAANRSLVTAINTKFDPNTPNIANDLAEVIAASGRRITRLMATSLSEIELKRSVEESQRRFEGALDDESWRQTFRGRDILKRLVARRAKGINYEVFRNLIVARMRDQRFQPAGMKEVLQKIAP